MGRKAKIEYSQKIEIVENCIEGKTTANYESVRLGIHKSSIDAWITNYKSMGKTGLLPTSNRKIYAEKTKISAVQDYLEGLGSYREICEKYKIRSIQRLKEWVKRYTSHEPIKTSEIREVRIMTKGRKTTVEERVKIVQYCIEHANNYMQTSDQYDVSYNQVYMWCKKYEENGLEGLVDRRGRTKQESEMTQAEKLRLENRLLQAEIRNKEMEISLLKKIQEIERGRF